MRYFENDVKEMFTNFGIKGDMLSTCMKKNDDSTSVLWATSIVFTDSDLVVIPKKRSVFSYEFLVTAIKYIDYRLISYINIENIQLSDLQYNDGNSNFQFSPDDECWKVTLKTSLNDTYIFIVFNHDYNLFQANLIKYNLLSVNDINELIKSFS
jgi:hypothetical protein